MSRTAACPSCGAPVEFRSAASILAICGYCQSTLLRNNEAIENLGRMADLVPDNSPLQIRSEGRWGGRHFALVGRIQLRYEAGVWNEWHLLFDDGRTGWLSEAGGEFVISFLKWVPDAIPAFEALVPGEAVTLDGRSYVVTDIEKAECVSGAGELPFKVGAGYPAPLADLRSGDQFATIDYSDGKPMVFFGLPVSFGDFGWANLREGVPLPNITEKAQALQCPACGGQIGIHDPSIAAVACPHCGSLSDRIQGRLEMVVRATGVLAQAPWLPLGSAGKLRDEDVEVIGAMVRSTEYEGISYSWREYLLLSKREKANTFLWLSEYNGHWTLIRTLSAPPQTAKASRIADIKFEGQRYEHFQTAQASVDYVIGEFTWRVRVGDTAAIDDFIAPPLMLSRETTEKEVVWSRGEYLEPAEVVTAFAIAEPPPAKIGVGTCQPSPLLDRHKAVCRRFWQFVALAVVIQIASVIIVGEKQLLKQSLTLQPGIDEPVMTREFRVDAGTKLTVTNKAPVNNSWLGVGVALVDKKTGKAWVENREIAYYSGVDDGESWSEGSQADSIVFRDLPAGTYVLAVDPELPPEQSTPIVNSVEVVQGDRVWSNLLLFLIFASIFPIITRVRQSSFEKQRWADSDHPKTSSGDDDDE